MYTNRNSYIIKFSNKKCLLKLKGMEKIESMPKIFTVYMIMITQFSEERIQILMKKKV